MSTQELETMPHASLQGWVPPVADESELRAALEHAFDYRGDVTITLKGGEAIVGYVFDRRPGKSLADSYVRILPEDSPKKRDIAYAEIAGLAFTGRDSAVGKSWEAWVKKYNETKAAGETNIGLHPDEHV